MIYREEPGRAVSGEAAPGEQAPTGADWPGFYLSARFRLWSVVEQAQDASARATREWGWSGKKGKGLSTKGHV